MSTTRSVLPLRLNSETSPPAPTLTVTRLGLITPWVRLRFDVPGIGIPDGHAVTKPLPMALTDVMFNTTADTPVDADGTRGGR